MKAVGTTDKRGLARRRTIVEIVSKGPVGNQADLAEALEKRGFSVTQATLSRDLKMLGIAKAPSSDTGYAYILPGSSSHESPVAPRRTLEIEAFVRDVRVVTNLVLVRTPPGNAQGVGRAIDELRWEEVQGTISGDDTILVVTSSATQAKQFKERLLVLMARR